MGKGRTGMLKITNLTKKYKNISVVDDFNLEIEKGHIYGIVGPNGAGKTTFFKMLAGLAKPTSGEITVSTGETLEKYRTKMSFMIETPYLYDGMTAFENMKIIGGIKGETDENRLRKLLELVRLDVAGKKKVRQFSLGMRQRLGIACALTSNPEILVLDEPMNGVDPEGIVELRRMLLELCKQRNITLLVSSHILGELFQLSTDFIFIKNGRIMESIDKKTLENTETGMIEIGTTDMMGTYEYLKAVYGENAVTVKNDLIQVKEKPENAAMISEKIVGAGFCITKINALSLNLEQYYMKEILKNEDI